MNELSSQYTKFFVHFFFLLLVIQVISPGLQAQKTVNRVLIENKSSRSLTGSKTVPAAYNVISNTCNTSTFRLAISAGPGLQTDVKEVQTLTNGNFVIAGNSISPGPVSEGLLFIMNNAGVIQAQQRLKINNSSTTLFASRTIEDGSIIVAGSVQDAGGKLFVAAFNNNLIPQWTTLLHIGQLPLKVVVTKAENGTLAVAAQLASSVKYAVLSATGTPLWQQECSPAGIDELAGIGQNNSGQISLIINCTRAGKKVADIITVTETNGAVFSSHITGNGTDEYLFGKVNSFNNRVLLTGVTNNAGQFKLIRQIMYNSNQTETVHTYDLPLTPGFDVSAANTIAGDAPSFCFPQLGKLVFIRHFADYQTTAEHTRSYDVPVGSSLSGVTQSLLDGGYLFSLNTATKDNIILIKTDSIGILAGCGYNTINNTTTEILNVQNTASGNVTVANTLVPSAGIPQQTTALLTLQTDCNQPYCPPPPPNDTCLSTYYKTFRSNSFISLFSEYFLMRNNNQLVLSARYDRVLGNSNNLSYGLELFNERGDFIKGISVLTNGVAAPVVIRKTDEQHVMMIHYTNSPGNPDYTFTLVDDSLRIVWSKSVKIFSGFPIGVLTYGNLTKDAEGNYYYISVVPGFNTPARMAIYKMDANGDHVWFKMYALPNSSLLYANIITTTQSLIAVIEGGSLGSVSVCLDKATGQLLNVFQYPNDAGGNLYTRPLGQHNGYVFYAGNSYANFQNKLILMVFDSTGLPVKMKKMTPPSFPQKADTKNGKFYLHFNYSAGGITKNGILRTDTTLIPDFITEYNDSRDDRLIGMGVSDNGSIYIGGSFYHGGVNGIYADAYIRKTDTSGVTGTCPAQPIPNMFIDVPLTVTSLTGTPLTGNLTPSFIPVTFLPDTNGHRVAELLCSSTPLCTTVDVTGPAAICQLNQPFTYLAQRNAGCNLRPQWQFDTAFAVLQMVTDTSAVFSFRQTGITKLYAKLNTGCSLYTDSIEVNIQIAPGGLNLGPDERLCPGDSIILNAGTGFNSYLWQNGSTDSIFIVHSPGQYYVQTSNLCGNVYNDTIVITGAVIPTLNIGPDVTVCRGDTLHLQAQPGFIMYNWFPTTGVTGNGQQALVVSTVNMEVWVSAITADGCIKSDTISVTSIQAPPVFLGRDTSFCINDSIMLQAGTGYQQYLWSTGAVTPSIIVKQAGTYWVQVTAPNGCSEKDTLVVIQTYTLPQPVLGNDFSICEGTQQRLDPGNFSTYLWQDGSTSRFYTAGSPGIYHVRVTDNNGCMAADTTILRMLLPSPSDFLNTTDSICEFSNATLSPLQNFNSYLWSTGSSQKTIIVSSPGNYILAVVNSNGCSGKDTISVVQKNCYNGVFIPTAFTPNNDGLNDLFKPVILGRLLSFSIEVFDRAGQRVFFTTNPANGWRGDVAGVLQSSGVYVWQCRYQLSGQSPGYQKGTVTLIR